MHTSNWARKQDITAFGSCCQHELGIAALDGSPAQRREKHKQHCTSPLQHAQQQRDEGSEVVKETEKPAQEKEMNMSMREKQAGTHQNKKHDKETKKRTAHAQKQTSNSVLRCSHRHAHTVFSCCESRKPAKCLFCVLFAGASLSATLFALRRRHCCCSRRVVRAFLCRGPRLRGPPWRQKPPAGIAVSACVSVRRRTTTEQTSRRQREREGSTSAQPAGPGDASPARSLASLARTNGMEQRERAKEGQCPSAGGCWCVMLSGAWHTCRDNSSCRANAGETRSSKHSTLWTMR